MLTKTSAHDKGHYGKEDAKIAQFCTYSLSFKEYIFVYIYFRLTVQARLVRQPYLW